MNSLQENGKEALSHNIAVLTTEEIAISQLLVENDQAHLFSAWSSDPETDLPQKRAFLRQVGDFHTNYPGGIQAYVERARHLLQLSAAGANPYEGFRVAEPVYSVRLTTPDSMDKYEHIGQSAFGCTGFVIVAGGLGERLGYEGIKLAIESETSTKTCFLSLYIQHILAMQQEARSVLGTNPTLLLHLAIMTSDDTDAETRELLRRNNNFGMVAEQLHLFKQGKVPSLTDSDAHFCLDESRPYTLDTKPHGHGDVHMLLYQNGIAQQWVREHGVRWIVFLQDTNGLVFRAIPAALGVSVERDLHMNSVTVPRVQGDAVGAICTLHKEDSSESLTINVEYNQLEGLLGRGQREPIVAGTKNTSVYPGNINVLIVAAPAYLNVLEDKKGAVAEFVNPKYCADGRSFKKPTRLECMMQDYPKLLGATERVGCTQFERWTAFSPVKNAIADGAAKQKTGNAAEVAATGEMDMYAWGELLLRECGCEVSESVDANFGGVHVRVPPRIVLMPSFGTTREAVKRRIIGGPLIRISARSTLILEGDVTIRSLDLDGTLVVRVPPGAAPVVIEGLRVHNKGWNFEADPSVSIRGYRCVQAGGEHLPLDPLFLKTP